MYSKHYKWDWKDYLYFVLSVAILITVYLLAKEFVGWDHEIAKTVSDMPAVTD